MHLRKPSCCGAHYGTDQSAAAHGPHEFFPHKWAEAIRCPGWSEEEAGASAVIEEVFKAPRGSRLEAHPAVIGNITRLLQPDFADLSDLATAGKLPGIITQLFGVPLVAAPLGPGEWRLVTEEDPQPGLPVIPCRECGKGWGHYEWCTVHQGNLMDEADWQIRRRRDQAREYEDFVLPNLATAWSEHRA